METTYEFRVREKYASLLFRPGEGRRLGELIRKIQIPERDPRLVRIGELYASIKREQNDYFFAGWDIARRYSAEELDRASLFLVHHLSTFEPAGEECGTLYDESSACPSCKSGAKQASPLFLNPRRIPKNKDIARTIAGEIVVSKHLLEVFERHSLTGADFRPVLQGPGSSAELKNWFHLLVKSCDAEVVPPTKAGVNPFDEDASGEFRCPLGDLIGLSRISEVWISAARSNTPDVVASRQFVGRRTGLIRPERFLLISPRLRRILEEQDLRGFGLEIAHLVSQPSDDHAAASSRS